MSVIYDLIERVLSVGDVHDKQMAKLAGEEIDKLESQLSALRAALALREQAQRDALAVLHRAHFYIMAQQFYTNGKTCDDCGGITEHCKGCATAELLAEIASILETLAALPRGEREE